MRGVHKFLGKGTFSALSLLADHHKGHPAYKQILEYFGHHIGKWLVAIPGKPRKWPSKTVVVVYIRIVYNTIS